ncbi:hypothetical protein P152DRAFT_388749 [Eremomyces bilateralis CBS 781.70]|uniref:PCI domain-containing protein n=1 Tax=Eremomyces bilateralis CBS 781.70 TaxID=1392243 RepID=A0A6G1GDY5_9PEZI|nr:uncharacterized protein P152DRAFT_388749 [Eremomyces bilateralis CBS 781.70]KAF1816307.1 hypothetical protein P152DRAFT_388749 [Eremomyces bilateralis CBS 781.70]
MAFSTNTLDLFLKEVNAIVQNGDGAKLASYLIIEPPYGEIYQKMISEVRQRFPKGNEDALEQKVTALLSAARHGIDGSPWTTFIKFIVPYLGFLRDVNLQNLLDTYDLLSDVVQKCTAALNHPSMGVIVLPTIVSYSKVLARLAIGLDKKPELIAHLAQPAGDDDGAQETLPERAANILVAAFKTCLADRTSSTFGAKPGKPEGKKVGIYTIANVCLKILFQCNKTRNAEHIFTNIYKQSPPLAIYPRQDRVTYLYYLGRYQFQNGHYYHSSQCLNEAYRLCPITFPRQRRLCLIYLITANLLLGRFPSAALLSREEAVGLADRFNPIIRTIKLGDLQTFRSVTSFQSPHAAWFLHFRILLPIQSKAETLLLRTLIRRTFLLAGNMGDADRRIAPTLDLEYVLHLWQWMERRILTPLSVLDGGPGKRHTNWIFMGDETPAEARYVDPDFQGIEELEEEGSGWRAEPPLPDMMEVESLFANMIEMGLLNGFVSHRQLRFAITGARQKGALAAGFPPPWETFEGRLELDDVPGWKKEQKSAFDHGGRGPFAAFGGQVGPGTVINLSGARPVGTGFG